MIALSDRSKLTPEEYLELEGKSPIKHEYIDGLAYAMAGTTDTHNTIALNLALIIRNGLRGSDCRVYFADVKVRLEQRNRFYYPDIFVTCKPQDREVSTYKRFPKLIVEVLSESTEAFDRGDKFNDYQTLESLQEYVLVNSKDRRVEIFRRNEDGLWLFQTYTATQILFELKSIDITVAFTDLYEDVTLK
ncbi:Uma2 family endonuclease [Lusitaniella coriacea LEGE 07157]|uniref:Uma2 family endonuclease n=1 Tax=Lusitaniella coriacea LEGE 07157 TaxID=945747 RepID=A0A8J7E5J0_9CYAN|nr:Uma2 family endonuclease [Lusitaniella coriacea]MBE9118679.1 Uma2 family endonuclease [Lusitaniella coriacea LEGE 07157]